MKKKNLVKYAGIALLTGSLTFAGGLAIHDHNFNHTEGICPLTKMLTNIGAFLNEPNIVCQKNLGVRHQINQMEKELDKKHDWHSDVRFSEKIISENQHDYIATYNNMVIRKLNKDDYIFNYEKFDLGDEKNISVELRLR